MNNDYKNSSNQGWAWHIVGATLTAVFIVGGFFWLVHINRQDIEKRQQVESNPAYQACLYEKSKKTSAEVDGVYYSWHCTDEGELMRSGATYDDVKSDIERDSTLDNCDQYRC